MAQAPVTIALGLPHTPWVAERRRSFDRLLAALRLEFRRERLDIDGLVACEIFDQPGANRVWSEAMWTWGAEQRATHFLTLQDDALVPENFWPALRAMLAAVPGEVIGLEAAHRAIPALAAEDHPWCTTADGLIGVGYAMPTAVLREFLAWRRERLEPGALDAVTEDTLVGLFCLAAGRRVWHPIPTIIDHDTTLPSTYGNDAHENRRPPASFRTWAGPAAALEELSFWALVRPVPHLGRFYTSTPGLVRRWVRGLGEADHERIAKDMGAAELRRLVRAAQGRSRVGPEPAARVLVCTPTLGGTHPEYNAAIWRLSVADRHGVELGFDLLAAWQWTGDLVRVRSRFVRAFLETDATHLFFVDADVSFEPELLAGLLAADRDYVAAPYPRRGRIDFAAVAKADGRTPEARAYAYALRMGDLPGTIDAAGCVEVAGVGLGCTLLRREALERMVQHYADPPEVKVADLLEEPEREHALRAAVERGRAAGAGLRFVDQVGGAQHPTTALFQLSIDADGALLSEDYAFGARWRAMGGQIWLYLGPGSPATHHGEHRYRGLIESLGLQRVPA